VITPDLLDGIMFGPITRSDVLYFRTDAGNRCKCEAAGMAPFVPFEDDRMTVPYNDAPDHILKDGDEIHARAIRAWETARRNRKTGKGKNR
jgi:DNA transformation protein